MKSQIANRKSQIRNHSPFAVHRSPFILCLLLAACCFLSVSCSPNQRILESHNGGSGGRTNAPAVNAAPIDTFDYDLKQMQTANFDFIYVFRRKDGGKLTAEDKKFAKMNSPFETNRFVVSDEERAIIAGSNTRFSTANLEALKSGFVVADFSKSEAELSEANQKANANRANINAANAAVNTNAAVNANK